VGLGNRVQTGVDGAGRVVARPVPVDEQFNTLAAELEDRGQESRRVHFKLSPNFGPDNPFLIVADQPITVDAGFDFEKYEIIVRDAVEVFIAFDEDAGRDHYDDVLVEGFSSRTDRCPPHRRLSLRFRDLPTKAVNVILYGGRAADPA
jgi:hypothetical protein